MLSSFERLVACWLLAGAILAGYLIPGLSEIFAPFTSISLFVLIMMSLLPMGRMEVNEVFTLDSKVWQIVFWQLLVLPAIIVAGAHLARIEHTTLKLMITTASASSLFASPTFAELLEVNKKRALQCMVLSTFLMPVSYFVFFTLILQEKFELDLVNYLNRCLIFLVVPLGLFLVYMGVARGLKSSIASQIERLSRRTTIFALVIFGIGIVGPARDLLHQDPMHFLLYLLIVSSLGIGMAYLTAVVMFQQGINDALTASIVSGFRNVGLGFMLLAGVVGKPTAQYVGISQIPIFLAPLVLSVLTRRHHSKGQASLVDSKDDVLDVALPARA